MVNAYCSHIHFPLLPIKIQMLSLLLPEVHILYSTLGNVNGIMLNENLTPNAMLASGGKDNLVYLDGKECLFGRCYLKL